MTGAELQGKKFDRKILNLSKIQKQLNLRKAVSVMKYTLKSGGTEIGVNSKGAELYSYKVNGEEFIWEADPEFWGASSPVLFPFVGVIKDGKYSFDGKEYEITTRHGFARTEEFEVVEKTDNFLKFKFSSNDETLKKYPFEFDLFLAYEIIGNALEIRYKVVNRTDGDMYFSLGAHPAFALDVNDEIKLNDYYLEFPENETAKKYRLNEKGLILDGKADGLSDNNRLHITETVFDNDAIIFKNLKSEKAVIKNSKNSKELSVDYRGFPYIAFWSKSKAPFLCIEPWFGISDFESSDGDLRKKAGIEKLGKGENFSAKLIIEGKKY